MAEQNEFKKLLSEEQLPSQHKKEVMKSIDQLKLIAEMADMFSIKQAKSRGSLYSTILGGDKSGSDSKK
ncbi:MAG: hypothetical protein ACI959_001190 [Limisphaerales bacterium]|jgi:hypothetical protein